MKFLLAFLSGLFRRAKYRLCHLTLHHNWHWSRIDKEFCTHCGVTKRAWKRLQ